MFRSTETMPVPSRGSSTVVLSTSNSRSDPSLGSMLTDGRQYLFRASWLAIYPGIALLLLVLAINLLGDGLSSFLDPRAKRRQAELKPL